MKITKEIREKIVWMVDDLPDKFSGSVYFDEDSRWYCTLYCYDDIGKVNILMTFHSLALDSESMIHVWFETQLDWLHNNLPLYRHATWSLKIT